MRVQDIRIDFGQLSPRTAQNWARKRAPLLRRARAAIFCTPRVDHTVVNARRAQIGHSRRNNNGIRVPLRVRTTLGENCSDMCWRFSRSIRRPPYGGRRVERETR
eukprot:6705771-Lingulodinium_polyedra.AAC.1